MSQLGRIPDAMCPAAAAFSVVDEVWAAICREEKIKPWQVKAAVMLGKMRIQSNVLREMSEIAQTGAAVGYMHAWFCHARDLLSPNDPRRDEFNRRAIDEMNAAGKFGTGLSECHRREFWKGWHLAQTVPVVDPGGLPGGATSRFWVLTLLLENRRVIGGKTGVEALHKFLRQQAVKRGISPKQIGTSDSLRKTCAELGMDLS